jgi:hypothetical protein
MQAFLPARRNNAPAAFFGPWAFCGTLLALTEFGNRDVTVIAPKRPTQIKTVPAVLRS